MLAAVIIFFIVGFSSEGPPQPLPKPVHGLRTIPLKDQITIEWKDKPLMCTDGKSIQECAK